MTRPALVSLLLACAVGSAVAAAPAAALIAPAAALDGPSATILDVDGSALAPDGSGGVVYRRISGGQPHVFALRYAHGHWSAPLRVDGANANGATAPAIAAGSGGRLLVVWVQPWAVLKDGIVHDQLESAVIDPGARGFGRPIEVDRSDVGDGSAAFPRLAMAPNGSAYVAYRVVTNPLSKDQPTVGIAPMRPGDELVDVRVARFNGLTWSDLPAINRLPGQVTMRRPNADNAPAIGVGPSGDGLIVWQEPGIDGVARLWGRRLFGTTPGVVLPLSGDSAGGRPVTTDADAPTIAFSQFSQAEVAYRLGGGAGSPFATSQLYASSIASSLDVTGGTAFSPPVDVEGATALGAPSAGIDDNGDVRLAYGAAGRVRIARGSGGGTLTPTSFGIASGTTVQTTIDPDGGGVSAWVGSDAGGRTVVTARQDFTGGRYQVAQLSAPLSGPVDGLSTSGSGLGDALIAFRQGQDDSAQVTVAVAKAPPGRFALQVPNSWVAGRAAAVSWDPAPNAIGRVAYSVVVDGQRRGSSLLVHRWALPARGLGDGVHTIQVLATDAEGQQTTTAIRTLQVDASPPRATARVHGRSLVVQVADDASGVRRSATRTSFGDGAKPVAGGVRARHRYARAGRYVVTVAVRDQVGNATVWHLRVQAR